MLIHSAQLPAGKMLAVKCRARALADRPSRHTRRAANREGAVSQSGRFSQLAGRREFMALTAAVVVGGAPVECRAGGVSQLDRKFAEAMAANDRPQEAIQLWTEAIELAPKNSAAWSNRGTVLLQAGRWQEARDDLARARALDEEAGGGAVADSLVLNNLANAEGALGHWDTAIQLYKEAAAQNDGEVQAIAYANASLAYFQIGQVEEAVREARQLLRRDAQFLDMRAALTAYLWALGDERGAEDEWEALQQAEDGLGGEIYSRSSAVARVRSRWPPRCTAALGAFLSLRRRGVALGYDGEMHEYEF